MKRTVLTTIDSGDRECGSCEFRIVREAHHKNTNKSNVGQEFCMRIRNERGMWTRLFYRTLDGQPMRLDDCIRDEKRAGVAIAAALGVREEE